MADSSRVAVVDLVACVVEVRRTGLGRAADRVASVEQNPVGRMHLVAEAADRVVAMRLAVAAALAVAQCLEERR